MQVDPVHLAMQIEKADYETINEKISIANTLFNGTNDTEDADTYTKTKERYQPLIFAAKNIGAPPYPSIAEKIEKLSELESALLFAQKRMARNPTLNFTAIKDNDAQMRNKLQNHEHRLTELRAQYDELAKEPSQKGTFPKTRNLYSHVAAFTEQVEELHDEIEANHTIFTDRANTLVEGASSLESLTEELSRDAKRHVNRKLGWLAAKIGSGIVVAAGALQLVEPLDILLEKYLHTPIFSSENKESFIDNTIIPTTVSALDDQDISYVLYIDRMKKRGTLYDLTNNEIIHTAPCSLAKRTGEKQVAGDGKTQSGIFKIEDYSFGSVSPLYGTAFINLEDKPYAQMQVVGASIKDRINAIHEGRNSTNGAVAFHNEDIELFVRYVALQGKESGRIVIEDPTRPLLP